MRPVGSLSDQRQAETFGDFLATIGVRNSVEPSSQGFTIWVHDEKAVPSAVKEFRAFCANPDSERYHEVHGAAEAAEREDRRVRAERARRIINPRQEWFAESRSLAGGFTGKSLRAAKLTLALIIVSVLVAFGTSLGDDYNELMNLLLIASVKIQGSTVSWNGLSEMLHGQVWRAVTPIFLHFGFLHIVFNMWWLQNLGSMIEARKGSLRLGLIVLVSAVASNLVEYWWAGPLAGGMSGVLYALFGYLWMKGTFEPWEGLQVSKSTIGLLMFWLFFCMTGWIGPIGNAAHVTGLAVGLVLGRAPSLLRRWRRPA